MLGGLLAGLLAMHVLAGGTHAALAVGPGSAAPAPPPSAPSTVEHAAGSRHDAMSTTTVPAAVPTAGERGPDDGGGLDDAGALCLAVLFAVALARAVPRAGAVFPQHEPERLPAWRRMSARPRGPPEDLLAQSCVLRT